MAGGGHVVVRRLTGWMMSRDTSKKNTIKRVLEPLARLTPRLTPVLKPGNDIVENRAARTGSWTSSGADPQFVCKFPLLDIHTGWYLITVDIECSGAFDVAKIYIDGDGSGYHEKSAISIPYRSGIVAKRFVRFSRKMHRMRFDPQSAVGSFTVRRFDITPVAFQFAEKRMLLRLTRWSAACLDTDVGNARTILQQNATENRRSYEDVLLEHYGALFVAPIESHGYQDWIQSVESRRLPAANDVDEIVSIEHRPLISVIMPTCETDPDLLQLTIDSVKAQSYDNWELCVSDDASTNDAVIDCLQQNAAGDARIKYVTQPSRVGIAGNTNAAISLASGQYCTFLDHDDLLAPHALFEVASVALERPEAKLIYSDEDKIDINGERNEPHFKPDWNPDLLLSQNYICHLTVVRSDVLSDAGWCRLGYDGAQDHDLLLRVSRRLKHHEVHHIPLILYHWRQTANSTAQSADVKGYSTDSGIRAVADHLSAVGEQAEVVAGKYPNTYRIVRELPADPPLVSIIIPTRDRLDILSQCVESVRNLTTYPNYEILVVDNRSEHPQTLEYLQQIELLKGVRVVRYDEDFNYSAINNFAVRHARGSILTLMNNDIEVISPDWLTEMVTHALRPEIGCVGAKLLYKNNMVQHAGVILGIGGVAGHAHKYFDSESAGYFSRLHLTQNMSAVTAACLTVERRIYDMVGGLNETDLKVAFNDVDFCLSVRALGFRNLWTPYAVLYHHESLSRGQEDTSEKQQRFTSEARFMQKKWGKSLVSDPAYNRNLTRSREDFSLAA
jgi:GT2 family glycosyltransferase